MKLTASKVSVFEKIGYSLGDLAANLVFQTLITYLAYFYTDIYGLKSTDASIIMLTVGLLYFYVIDKKMEVKIEAELKARRGGNAKPIDN